ncbi:hypothetical protein N7495_004077 [Penicillium taxi]|uniref:uncharacterized protein n=1 Tax=Penicillium taxi TaxID=168475 RepID=UPI002544F474|nr:uncharacterized protein N7495_004077 [Penicillium taxi]KAJ5899333.1 hypothetical protein N7495_004077 [Penicillium taxi]
MYAMGTCYDGIRHYPQSFPPRVELEVEEKTSPPANFRLLNIFPAMAAASENRDTAIQEAKIFVRKAVRHDWEFPAETVTATASLDLVDKLSENREVVEWRFREFDTSSSDLGAQSSDTDDSDSEVIKNSNDPETVLRRKRRRQINEEMAWNEGLRMFIARRDAWSGARTRRQIRIKEKERKIASVQADTSTASDSDDTTVPSLASPAASDAEAPVSQLTDKADTLLISEREQEDAQSIAQDDETTHKESTETGLTVPDQTSLGEVNHSMACTIDDSDSEEELDEPVIPVAPPFIPADNIVRSTITPNIYPSIYTKVVVQGMTPTVPVNLADLTNAMVQGWKADGQWPPKPAVTSIVLQDDASIPKRDTGASDGQSPPARRKNSITNTIRKVFHNPFHRRGPSNDSAINELPPSGAV